MADGWLDSPVKADAPISDYRMTVPSGMSNPPRNPQVRHALMQDLQTYGVDLEYGNEWPPPLPDSCKSPPVAAIKHSHAILAAAARARQTQHRHFAGSSSLPARVSFPSTAVWHQSNSQLSEAEIRRTGEEHGFSASRLNGKGIHGAGISKDSDGAAGRSTDERSKHRTVRSLLFNDQEVRSKLASLRAQNRMHKAAVRDQFRFVADCIPGTPMVIRGAASETSPLGAWVSEAAHLTYLHNRAMRAANPSRLELLPQEPLQRKKKKAEDDLDMGDSGRFRALYKADKSYREIRVLRRDMAIDHERSIKAIPLTWVTQA